MKKFFAILLALALALATLAVPAMAEKTVITLSHTGTVTLAIGDTLQLASSVAPEAPVEWSSGKPGVASVDANGLVCAAGEGSATIKARAGGKSAKVKIKVVDPYKPTGVSIAQGKSITIGVGEAVQLNAVLAPATAQAAMTWTSNKPGVASVDANGVVTGVGSGKAKITVQAGKKKAKIKVKVVGSEQHQHSWQDVTDNRYIVDSPAWDETVVLKEAWDEQTGCTPAWDETVVLAEPYDETVTVPAWTETVVDKEGWTEIIPYVLCNGHRRDGERCNKRWYSMEDYQKDFEYCTPLDFEFTWWLRSLSEEKLAHLISELKKEGWSAELCEREGCKYPEAGAADFCSHWCYTSGQDYIEHPAETHTVEHPEETRVVHHDAETAIRHHDAEPIIVHHDAETTVIHHDEAGHWETVVVARLCATCGAVE